MRRCASLLCLVLLACADARAQEGLLLTVANNTTGNVRIFRTNADGTLTAGGTVAVGAGAFGAIARDDQAFVYVTNATANTLSVIDTRTEAVVQTVPGFTTPRMMALSPDNLRLYVSNNSGAVGVHVFSVDAPQTGQLTALTTLTSGLDDARGLALTPDGGALYVVSQGNDTVKVFDTSTFALTASIAVGAQPIDVAINPAGTRAYVSNFSGNSVSVIDIGTRTVIDTIAAGGNGPTQVAVRPDGSAFYVENTTSGTVSQFNASTNTAIAPPVSTSGLTLFGIAITPNGDRLYTANQQNDLISIFAIAESTGALTSMGTQAVGLGDSNPSGIALCRTGNRLLATGATFVATSSESIGCMGPTPTFTGGTLLVTANNLAFTTPFSLGAGGGTITTNGNDATIAGIISGSTQLTKTGAGVLTLSGANTYAGVLSVQQGTLRAAAANTLSANGSVNIASGAALDLAGFSQTVGALSGQGTVSLGSATLTTGSTGDPTISGTINGTGGLTKTGSGFLFLQGNNTYTGPTTVSGGGLILTGSVASSAVTVGFGATLDGTGTTGPLIAQAGASIIPGLGGPGQLTTGTLTLMPSSSLNIGLAGATTAQYDRVVVNGTVTIGGLLQVNSSFTPAPGTTFTIISATGAVSGTFASRPNNSEFSIGIAAFRITYGPTFVSLTALAKLSQTISFAALETRSLGSAPFTVSATATSGLSVTFTSQTASVCTVVGNTVTLVAPGTCTIAADQAGDGNFSAAARVLQSFLVTPDCSGSIAPAQLAVGLAAMPYNQSLTLTTGAGPITFSVSGTLPPGITVTNGVFSGTPTVRGAFPVTATATDANGCQTSASYSLAISAERRLVIGAGAGAAAIVRAFNLASATPPVADVNVLGTFTGGVSVAQGDINGDGVSDVVSGAGPGGAPIVTVVDGASGAARLAFSAFDPAFRSGVEVAAGDVNGDGLEEIIVVGGCAAPSVIRAFNGVTGALVREYPVVTPVWSCGLHVAAGDVNGDGVADIVLGSGGIGAPFVQVIDGVSGGVVRESFPYEMGFTGGVYVAAGDVNGDGFADVVTGAGPGGAPQVRVFDGATGAALTGPLGTFTAYTPAFAGGVRVAAGDLNGDGRAEVITGAGPGGGPHVRVFDGATATEVYGLYALDPSFTGGVFVAAPSSVGRMAIDLATRTTANQVRIAGWGLRELATDTTGTDAIHAWAYPVDGSPAVFVGAAPARTPRSDVAAAFGGEFLMSGFDFTGALAPGTYDLVVFVQNSRTLRFDQARVVRITVN